MTTTLEKIYNEYTPMVKDFQRAGVNVALYKRPPARGSFTLAGMPRGRGIHLWPGLSAELEYNTDRKHHQAVLNVHEGAHALPTGATNIWHGTHFHGAVSCNEDSPCARLRDEGRLALLAAWNLDSKGGRVTNLRFRRRSDTYGTSYTVTGEVQRPTANNHFLIGIDETAHFVAELPHRVDSVADAHSALRPSAARIKGTLRQGEFFLVPANVKEQAAIDRHLSGRRTVITGGPLERRSTHVADLSLTLRGKLFVTSRVLDGRPGRHEPLRLDGWYKVVRNLEVTTQGMDMPVRQRYWD